MEILRQIYADKVRVAVLIDDNGEQYSIPLEGLFVQHIFDELKSAGWILDDAESYEFVKNGTALSTLPIDDTVLTDDDLVFFSNFTLRDDIIPQANRAAYQTRTVKNKAFNSDVHYTINTREEFAEYLKSIEAGISDQDFRPINYFVAPEARFDLEEITKGVGLRAMQVLERRRMMSWARFFSLKAWIASRLGKETITSNELVDEYMSWGIDGINVDRTNVEQMVSVDAAWVVNMFDENPSATKAAWMRVKNGLHKTRYVAIGRIDNDIIYPKDISQQVQNRPVFPLGMQINKDDLNMNEYKVVPIIVPDPQLLRHWSGYTVNKSGAAGNVFIEFSNTHIYIRTPSGKRAEYKLLNLQDPTNFSRALPEEYWEATSIAKLQQETLLRSLSKEMYNKRRVDNKDTSFSILLEMGFTPGEAIRAIASKLGFWEVPLALDKNESNDEESLPLFITGRDVFNYFQGFEINDTVLGQDFADAKGNPIVITKEHKSETIEEIMRGGIDFKLITSARAEQDKFDESQIYNALITARDALGIRPEEIILACQAYDGVTDTVTLNSIDGKKLIVSIPECNLEYEAAIAERQRLLTKQITEARHHFKIYDVAKELSRDETIADRHVGVAGVAFYWDYKNMEGEPDEMRALLDTMIQEFMDFCRTGDKPLKRHELEALQITAAKMVSYFILTIYENGYNTNDFKGRVPEEWVNILDNQPRCNIIHKNCYHFAASTLSICDTMWTNQIYSEQPTFNYYCVNALITPTRVYVSDANLVHECNLLCTYDWDVIKKNILDTLSTNPQRAGLVATRTYLNGPSRAWNAVDIRPVASNGVSFGYTLDRTVFRGSRGLFTFANIYSDVYNAQLSDEMDESDENMREVSEKSSYHAKGVFYSLYVYSRKSRLMLNSTKDKFFVAPTHPAEELYPDFYASTLSELRDFREGDVKSAFRLGTAAALAGPNFVNTGAPVGGLPVKQYEVSHSTNMLLNSGTSDTERQIQRINGFRASDISMCRALLTHFFDTSYKILIQDSQIYTQDGQIEIDDLFNLAATVDAIKCINNRVAIVKTADSKFWRVER